MYSNKLIRGITAHSNSIRNLCSTTFLRANKSIADTEEPARLEKTINSVQLLGRVGADPVLKGTNEHPVAIFSLATHTNYRYETGEFVQRTEWHRVVCFKPALRETIMNFMKKGQRVHVTGKLTYGEVKGEDGKPRATTAIQADDVIFFQKPNASQTS
ncbi:hypothetical protein AMK59_6654 [Oryctes borbonicus]|uniref:Single-stranded DNA-binding protein n=1 Tax=Oryctes borbonicus TaxID=1629725 RepID=A0A0T6ATB8_9SCAR|nr:hypothetical protein AMK59_6654 [Oryctes borbonicus]